MHSRTTGLHIAQRSLREQNFANNPTCRLINPAKSEIGRISKQVLQRINTDVRNKTSFNQWKNYSSVIEWFKNIADKNLYNFTVFEIESFYPSISQELLTNVIHFAKKHTKITNQDIDIIMHSRKSILFQNRSP